MEAILLLVLGTIVGGALGARVAGFDAWRGAVVVTGASVIVLTVQVFFGINSRLIDILVFLVAVGILGGAVKLPGRALSSVVLGAFLFAAVVAGFVGAALSPQAAATSSLSEPKTVAEASVTEGHSPLGRKVIGLTHVNQALGEKVNYLQPRIRQMTKEDVSDGAWTIADPSTEVICFADGNNAVFFTVGGRVFAANGKARQFVRHEDGDGILFPLGEVIKVHELEPRTHVELVSAVIDAGLGLCGQKSVSEISAAATAATPGAGALSSSTEPGQETPEQADVLRNVALAIRGAELCGYGFDPVAVVDYMVEHDVDQDTYAAEAEPYLLLADGILRGSGDLPFCQRSFLPKFGPDGLRFVSERR